MSKIFTFVGLLVIGVIAGLYASEGFLWYRSYDATGPEDFRRAAKQIERDQGRLLPALNPSTWEVEISEPVTMEIGGTSKPILPLSSVAKSKTLTCLEDDGWMVHTRDRYGFHNPDEVWEMEKPDFLIFSDSTGSGHCVKREFTFGTLFRKAFPKTINLSHGGYELLGYLALISEFVPRLKPKYVVLLMNYNDMGETTRITRNSKFLNLYLNKFSIDYMANKATLDAKFLKIYERHKSEIESRTDDVVPLGQHIINTILLRRIRHNFGIRFKNASVYREKREPDFYMRIFKRIGAILHEQGTQGIVLYLPDVRGLTDVEKKVWVKDDVSLAKRLAVDGMGGTFNDLTPLFLSAVRDNLANYYASRIDPLYGVRMFGHFNREGYALFSKQAIEEVKKVVRP